jgi:TolB-like protein
MKGSSMKHKWIFFFLCASLLLSFPTLSATQTKEQTKEVDQPPKIYKVAILPFLIHSQENLDYIREGIYDIISSRITVGGRIDVIDRSTVERALHEERPTRLDETVAINIGKRTGADYIVLGSLTKIGSYISLDARLISVTEQKPPLGVYTQHKGLDDVMVKIEDFAQDIGSRILGARPRAGRRAETPPSPILRSRDEFGRIGPEGLGFKKTQTLETEIKGLDIGDVDGDKKNEVVVMDNHNLYIFKYDGERMNLFRKIEHGSEHNFLTLDVADVNRNGYAEIIVTSVVEDDLRSFIIEYEEGEFRMITEEANWYFRVLDHPAEGPMLMGQRMGSEGIPVGPIYKMVWKKKAFVKGPKMPFPKDTGIFGVAMGDVRQTGKPDVVLLDPFERLNIISGDGKAAWRSGEQYGGTNNFYDTKKKKPDAFRPNEAPPWRVFITGRIVVKDLDGDGVPEVIVSKNEFSTGKLFERMRSPESGEIYDLVWEKDGLTMNWKTREIKGYVADFQVKDADNDGVPDLLVAMHGAAEGYLAGITSSKTRSNILFFKLF